MIRCCEKLNQHRCPYAATHQVKMGYTVLVPVKLCAYHRVRWQLKSQNRRPRWQFEWTRLDDAPPNKTLYAETSPQTPNG